jgi:zinc transport system substrate-binding protein
MRKVLLSAGLVLAAVLPFVGCKPKTDTPTWGDGTVRVAVSFPALYSLVANVVGDTGTVRSVKSTQGAHGSEVTSAEREVVESADVLFINGHGLDNTFAKKLRESSANPNVTVVALGEKVPHKMMLHGNGCACCEEGHEGEADEDEHDAHDPHVWLGIDPAVRMVEAACKELSGKYPQHADTFKANADAYIVKLKAIKTEGEAVLANTPKEDRKLVTAHGSMGYFAKTFGLTVVDSIQKTAGKEPTKKQLDELVAACKKEGVKVIAAEPQTSKLGGVKTLAEALKAAGITATVIELDNLETATAADLKPDWYEVKMRANIAALKDVFK